MKFRKSILITTILICSVGIAFAALATIDGKWTGTLNAPDGNQYPLNYTFKNDNGNLTGTGDSPQGSVDLTNGKVTGDSIYFSIEVNGVTILNNGKYYSEGDSISFNTDYQGIKFHSTLKRAVDK